MLTKDKTLEDNYLSFITGMCGFLKAILGSISVVVALSLSAPDFPRNLVLGFLFGGTFAVLLAIGYVALFIDTFKVHLKITWHRVVFVDIIVTLTFIVLLFMMPTEFHLVGIIWSLSSMIADFLAQMIILDPGLLKFNRILGIVTLIVGLVSKFSGSTLIRPEISGFLSVLGGVLSIIGVGEQAK